MFGYVKPYAPNLLVREHEFYKATYCGLCRTMRKSTGALSALSLSYDLVLLVLVRTLYEEDKTVRFRSRRRAGRRYDIASRRCRTCGYRYNRQVHCD